jgi:lipopolysaccharide biosynthesis protein
LQIAFAQRGGIIGALPAVWRVLRRDGFVGLRHALRRIRIEEPPSYSLSVPFQYEIDTRNTSPCIAVLCHMFHDELAPQFRRYFEKIPFPCSIFISTDTQVKQSRIRRDFTGWTKGEIDVRLAPNRGRDIAPKLIAFADVHARFRYVLHVHSKRSAHDPGLSRWCEFLLENLLGSSETVSSIFEIFARFPNVGLVSSQHFEPLRHGISWGDNFALAETLAARMGIDIKLDQALDFPSGSMFWARSAALKPLLDLQLRVAEFPDELGQLDGTLAHAIERLYYFTCERAGFNWVKISHPNLFGIKSGIIPITSPAVLDRYMRTRVLTLTAAE